MSRAACPPAPPAAPARRLLLAVVVGCAASLADGHAAGARPSEVDLRPRYRVDEVLRVEAAAAFELGDHEIWLLVEGREPERLASNVLRQARHVRRHTTVEHILEVSDGRPVRSQRNLERIEGSASTRVGAAERSRELSCPLDGLTLELADGEIARVVMGADQGEPPDEALLEGREPGLALDALLPPGPVEPGSSWELDDASLHRALSVLLEDERSFPTSVPRREGQPPDVGQLGAIPQRLLNRCVWSGHATLELEPAAWRDAECHAIRLELRAGLESTGDGAPPGRIEIEGEGRLLVAIDGARPVQLALEGQIRTVRQVPAPDPDDTETRRRLHGRGAFDLRVEVAGADGGSDR